MAQTLFFLLLIPLFSNPAWSGEFQCKDINRVIRKTFRKHVTEHKMTPALQKKIRTLLLADLDPNHKILTPEEAQAWIAGSRGGLTYRGQEICDDVRRFLGPDTDESSVARKAAQYALSAFDPYTVYFDETENENFQSFARGTATEGVGILFKPDPSSGKLLVQDIVPQGPADHRGIRLGDALVGIDGTPVDASLPLNKILDRILGKSGTPITLEFTDESGQQKKITLTRGPVDWRKLWFKENIRNIRGTKIGVIRLGSFFEGSSIYVRTALQRFESHGVEGVLIDLEDNGGGAIQDALQIAGFFVDSGPLVGLTTRWKGIRWIPDPTPGEAFSFPLVILVNSKSASASELVAGTLQSRGRAVIISRSSPHTFGKGSHQSYHTRGIPEGGALKITRGFYYLPNGTSPQYTGVRPDLRLHGNTRSKKEESEKDQLHALRAPSVSPIFQVPPQEERSFLKRIQELPTTSDVLEITKSWSTQ